MLFRKKKKEPKIDPDREFIVSRIRYGTSSPKKLYEVTADEIIFIDALISYMRNEKMNPRTIKITRLSDGTLNVFSKDAYLGKIRLQGRKRYIQWLPEIDVPKAVYVDNVEDTFKYIPLWFAYK